MFLWPATVAEDEEEHAENDAGHSYVNSNDDACSGGFNLLIFYAVARAVQHWGGKHGKRQSRVSEVRIRKADMTVHAPDFSNASRSDTNLVVAFPSPCWLYASSFIS